LLKIEFLAFEDFGEDKRLVTLDEDALSLPRSGLLLLVRLLRLCRDNLDIARQHTFRGV